MIVYIPDDDLDAHLFLRACGFKCVEIKRNWFADSKTAYVFSNKKGKGEMSVLESFAGPLCPSLGHVAAPGRDAAACGQGSRLPWQLGRPGRLDATVRRVRGLWARKACRAKRDGEQRATPGWYRTASTPFTTRGWPARTPARPAEIINAYRKFASCDQSIWTVAACPPSLSWLLDSPLFSRYTRSCERKSNLLPGIECRDETT